MDSSSEHSLNDASCPFCGAPKSGYPVNGRDGVWECGTEPYGGDEARTRTHKCYMNQIRSLQTGGETDYAQGWHAGLDAAFSAMADARSSWKVKNPPLRRQIDV